MIIKLQNLITEGRYDYGCVMARMDEGASRKILDFNHKTIGEEFLYTEEENHGRENTPHVTVKFGLTESYTEDQIREIIKETRPFLMEIRGISLFENEKFDVVKFDIEGKKLRALREIFNRLPNQDSHPEYNPHMTLAYVRRGMGRKYARNAQKSARVPVNTLEYSDKGKKYFINL